MNDKYNERWMHTSANPPICTQKKKKMQKWTTTMCAIWLPFKQLQIQLYFNPQQWMTNTKAMMNTHIGQSPHLHKNNNDTVEQGLQVREANTWTLTSSHLFMHSFLFCFFLTEHNTVQFKTKFQNDNFFFSLSTEYFFAQRHAHVISMYTPARAYLQSEWRHSWHAIKFLYGFCSQPILGSILRSDVW